jgi:hypothetical protein
MQFPSMAHALKCSGAGRAAPENSSARAGAFREQRLHAKAGYLHGDPLRYSESARSPRREQVAIGRAPETADEDIAERAFVRQAEESPAASPVSANSQGSRRVALVAGAIGLLVPALGFLGYQQLSKEYTGGPAPALTKNVIEEKTVAAGQALSGAKRLDRSASTSPTDQPKKVRIVAFRPHGGATNTPASDFTLGAGADLEAFAAGSADLSPVDTADGEAARIPAPLHLERSKLIAFGASSGAGQIIDNHEASRAGAMSTADSARNRKIECRAAAGRGGHWAWRIIDSRKCWYEGKAGMSKDNLRWVFSAQ